MKVLVTGGTGRVGSAVVDELIKRKTEVRVLSCKQDAKVQNGVEIAVGNMLDPDSLRNALTGIDKVFLLSGPGSDELTQSMMAFNLARQ